MEDKSLNLEDNVIKLYYFKLMDKCNKISIPGSIG